MAQRARTILSRLLVTYPSARIELEYSNKHELLFATILSAQCTDVRVNQVTPYLFSRFPELKDYADADLEDIEGIIRPTGFYHQKARAIKGCARILMERFDGSVPSHMQDLLMLPGVGRKTANVVLQNAFGIQEGVVVDTHVGRIAKRLGLTRSNDPARIEQDLMAHYPSTHYLQVADAFIFHGRRTCFARNPACDRCPVYAWCIYEKKLKKT